MAFLSQFLSFIRLLALVLGILGTILASPTRICAQTYPFTLDFEDGTLRGWTAWGDAFKFQPTRGDNPTARKRGQPSNHQGNYWIGTYERYQGKPGQRPGDIQGDAPQGYLTSASFTIPKGRLTFLVGGGSSSQTRVELWVGPSSDIEFMEVVHSASGKNSETMDRVTWDLSPYAGKYGKIRIVDNSSGPWGHINVDDFRFISLKPPATIKPSSPSAGIQPPAVKDGILVPNVVGKPVKIAREILVKSGLKPGKEIESSSKSPDGIVLKQKPGPKEKVAAGTAVDLVVAIPKMVPVPNVIGKPVKTARNILAKFGLKPGEEEKRPSGQPEGTVLNQFPRGGGKVPVGAPVRLVVAVPELVVVPKVVDRSLEEAKFVLAKASLELGSVEEHPDNKSPGTVLRQTPSAGTKVKAGSRVDLVVAVPPPAPTKVEVPFVEGQVVEEARGILKNVHLQVGEIEERFSDARPGTVIRQNPGPGAWVEIGGLIDLVVAVPPLTRMIEVPDVTGLPLTDARQVLQGQGLTLGVVGERVSDREAGSVLEQSPGGGSKARPGDAVSLVVAAKGSSVPWGKVAGGLAAAGAAGVMLLRLMRRSRGKGGTKDELEVIPRVDEGFQDVPFSREKEAPDWEVALRPVPDPGKQVLEVNGPLIAEKEGGNE